MKAFRGICTLLLLVGWVKQSGVLVCERPNADHPACPMHAATGGAGLHVESATGDVCHDAGSASHCIPGQSCTVSLEAVSPDAVSAARHVLLRSVAGAAASRWRSCDTTRSAPPPRPANRTA